MKHTCAGLAREEAFKRREIQEQYAAQGRGLLGEILTDSLVTTGEPQVDKPTLTEHEMRKRQRDAIRNAISHVCQGPQLAAGDKKVGRLAQANIFMTN